jgi:serine/threonine-protein kinase
MEYLDGVDLDALVRLDGPQPPARAVHVLTQVCGALGEAHAAGLIHRDIKPANILLCRHGGVPDVAKVVDFGLVKPLSADVTDIALSGANALTGTPMYLSPEAIRTPDDIDARSDLYALGAVGYYLVTGQHVFTGRTLVEMCGHHLHSEPTPPAERLGRPLPEDLCDVLLRCLAKDPARRPPDARALRAALRACTVPPWREEEAAAWWQARGKAVMTEAQAVPRSAHGATVAVDMRGREAPREASSE